MSDQRQNNDYFYSGGLAEFVPSPSPLTFSFFSYWFMGSTALGKAMQLLGLPYESVSLSLLEKYGEDCVVNLQQEEKTLYKNTVFTYKTQKQLHETPNLTLSGIKTLNPFAWINTGRILVRQTQWIADAKKTTDFAHQLLANMPKRSITTLEDIDLFLTNQVWPVVIVIGILSEFYHQLLKKEIKNDKKWQEIQTYISAEVAKTDWFLTSFTDQQKVKNGSMSFDQYIQLYGNRADMDYEISSPRWSEIPKEIEERIKTSQFPSIQKQQYHFENEKEKEWTQAVIELMILRSEAKKQALTYIALLRNAICSQAHTINISDFERSDILNSNLSKEKMHILSDAFPKSHQKVPRNGQGSGIAAGEATGKIIQVKTLSQDIPSNAICVFPNASPQFGQLFPKCSGMIFLKGGQTSHGAIVAREFGIPAIVSHEAEHIPDNQTCHIVGSTGAWEIIK